MVQRLYCISSSSDVGLINVLNYHDNDHPHQSPNPPPKSNPITITTPYIIISPPFCCPPFLAFRIPPNQQKKNWENTRKGAGGGRAAKIQGKKKSNYTVSVREYAILTCRVLSRTRVGGTTPRPPPPQKEKTKAKKHHSCLDTPMRLSHRPTDRSIGSPSIRSPPSVPDITIDSSPLHPLAPSAFSRTRQWRSRRPRPCPRPRPSSPPIRRRQWG